MTARLDFICSISWVLLVTMNCFLVYIYIFHVFITFLYLGLWNSTKSAPFGIRYHSNLRKCGLPDLYWNDQNIYLWSIMPRSLFKLHQLVFVWIRLCFKTFGKNRQNNQDNSPCMSKTPSIPGRWGSIDDALTPFVVVGGGWWVLLLILS